MAKGWFLESVRHSLAAQGVKTKQEKKPLIGRHVSQPHQFKESNPDAQVFESDPKKRWLWGIKLRPTSQAQAIVRQAIRAEGIQPGQQQTQPTSQPTITQSTESKPTTQEKTTEQKPVGINPNTLVKHDKSILTKKRSKAKYENVDAAWEAAQNELSNRYDGSNETGVIKDDDEQDRKLAQNMGLR